MSKKRNKKKRNRTPTTSRTASGPGEPAPARDSSAAARVSSAAALASSTAALAATSDRGNPLYWVRQFHRFWFFDIDPFIIGLYRLALGLALLLFYFMLFPSWLTYYGPDSISTAPIVELKSFSDYKPFNSLLRHVTTESGYWVFYWICIVTSIMLTVGWLPRLSACWLWIANFSTTFRNPFVVNGEEQIFAILLVYGMFLPLGRSCTLRQLIDPVRRRAMFFAEEKVRVWSLTILQVQIALMYLLSWPYKLTSCEEWRNGLAVYYAMLAINYPRWPGMDIFNWWDAIISRLMTWFTLVVELVAPLLIWFRRCRVICTLFFVVLHLGLGFLLEGVILFNVTCLVAFIVFFPSRRTRELLRECFYGEERVSLRLLMSYVLGSPCFPPEPEPPKAQEPEITPAPDAV